MHILTFRMKNHFKKYRDLRTFGHFKTCTSVESDKTGHETEAKQRKGKRHPFCFITNISLSSFVESSRKKKPLTTTNEGDKLCDSEILPNERHVKQSNLEIINLYPLPVSFF